jgi:hypothetical protein
MQATNILGQRTLPRYRHPEKQRFKTIVVEAFPEVTSGREDHPRRIGIARVRQVSEVACAFPGRRARPPPGCPCRNPRQETNRFIRQKRIDADDEIVAVGALASTQMPFDDLRKWDESLAWTLAAFHAWRQFRPMHRCAGGERGLISADARLEVRRRPNARAPRPGHAWGRGLAGVDRKRRELRTALLGGDDADYRRCRADMNCCFNNLRNAAHCGAFPQNGRALRGRVERPDRRRASQRFAVFASR